jgi:ligand-binding sensor domain-containing protein
MFMGKRFGISLVLVLLLSLFTKGQHSSLNFHKLGLENGLNDGTIRCIGQDKLGYIWIGSVSALNRFDGKNVAVFTNIPGDTTSPYVSQPRSIHSDAEGRFWIGFETGLAEFDFSKAAFKRIGVLQNIFIAKIISYGDSLLYLATRRGLIRYNKYSGNAFFYSTSKHERHAALIANGLNDLLLQHDSLYMATDRGMVVMNLHTDASALVPISVLAGMAVLNIASDQENNIWLGMQRAVNLVKLKADRKSTEVYDRFLTTGLNKATQNVSDILVDNRNRVWVVTPVDGLLQYDVATNSFIKHLHHADIPSSPKTNYYRTIFQDDRNIIWLGEDFAGVNFFEPDHFLFQTILPSSNRLDEWSRGVGRAVAEDKQGNIWMGNHAGVSRYNPSTLEYTLWHNEGNKLPVLYSNTVRSMYCDNENNIWIGTASGVNRYNQRTQKMEFIDSKNLPLAYYNSITEDRAGNIWFCTNDTAVLYWYSTTEKKYFNISTHPQLKQYKSLSPTSYVMEDSKKRLWISFSRKGVVMLDKRNNVARQFLASETNRNSIIGNQVIDIKEDNNGVIWLTSINGITGIDVERDSFLSFNHKNGLPGNWAAPLLIDKLNRIWVGVNGGLTMLDTDRKQFTIFSPDDGLPSIGFPEHAGIQTFNGDFVMPTYKGYIRFNPLAFKHDSSPLRFYLAGYSIFDKHYTLPAEQINKSGIQFDANENSFAFDLVALNYTNPSQTWFAYKLDGFDKDWHYSKDTKAVYTNVPGGDYVFMYKAATANDNWESMQAKRLKVGVKTFFYKSVWFWSLIGLLLVSGLFGLYRRRTGQQQQLFQLKSKTQLLEKEKAMVMYDSLKQQLNPHFLFNSLTSLSGLIETDQHVASEFLDQMSSIYRYILKNGNQETVSVYDEIAFVKLYIDLQQTRFGNGLKVNIQVPEEYMHYKIAPVTLQNLIENAIKHNVVDESFPLVIDIFIEDDCLVVRNNLQKKGVVETSNKKGLEQFVSLYSFLSTKPVVITETADAFIIRIPLV